MLRRVLWLSFCSLLLSALVRANLNNCNRSREAYVNLELGNADDVPINFTDGAGASICSRIQYSCCPTKVELSMQRAATDSILEAMPAYSLYLNRSEGTLFPSYGYTRDVIVRSIRDYFTLSVPDVIRKTTARVSTQINNLHLKNTGSGYEARMKQLFSSTYLERMKGLYGLGPDYNYNNNFTNCARSYIEANQISSEIKNAINIIEYQFRSLYFLREVLYSIHILLVHLESGLPYASCVRSYAELFYCQICLPETASLFPCRNVCKNVLSGCTIFHQVTGEELIAALQAQCQLNIMSTHSSWNLHTALEVVNDKLYSIFDMSTAELLKIASNVSSCSDAPMLASNPTPTNNPNRTTAGREQLLSKIPTSLTDDLYQTLVIDFSTFFTGFENITERVLQSECGSFPENNGSRNFECWRRMIPSGSDVDFLGINFTAVLRNPDLDPPEQSFINTFNSLVANMKTNATQTMTFINNFDVPDDMRVNMDRCRLPLSEMLSPIPTPTTGTFVPTTISMPATTPLTPEPTQPTDVVLNNGSSQWTRLNTGLLLLPAILLFMITA